MPRKVFLNNTALDAADLNEGAFSDAVQADVATDQATSSTSYGDLTTVGPSVTMTLTQSQQVMVTVYALMINQTVSGGEFMSFAVSGVESLAASDNNAANSRSTDRVGVQKTTWYTAGTTGSHTFTAKYKAEASGSASFSFRRISVKRF